MFAGGPKIKVTSLLLENVSSRKARMRAMYTHTLKDRLPENILPLVAPSADWMEVQKFNDVETEKQTDFP